MGSLRSHETAGETGRTGARASTGGSMTLGLGAAGASPARVASSRHVGCPNFLVVLNLWGLGVRKLRRLRPCVVVAGTGGVSDEPTQMQLGAALVAVGDRPAGHAFVCTDRRLRQAGAREGFEVLPGE
jgi:hypothetical protein